MSDPRDDRLLSELADELDPREREALAARLAVAAEAVEPDPAVRERVMARIDRAEALRSARAARRWRAAASLAVAAALGTLLVWSGVGTFGQPDEGETARVAGEPVAGEASAELEELEELLGEQDEEIAGLERELASAREALSVLTAERVERLTLEPVGEAGEAVARVYWDWDEYSCYFVAEGLPPSAGDAGGYALWLHTDAGETLLAGRFAASPRGPASFFAMLPKDMGKVVRAVVTAEPETAGDSPDEPAGPVVLAGGQAL